MMRVIKILILIACLLAFISCDEDPATYVGDLGETTSGVVIGSVIDSTSRAPLDSVEVVASSIFVDSTSTDTAFTNMEGIFVLDFIYEAEYYLSFKKDGYMCKDIWVSVEDTLRMKKPVTLLRLP